MIPGPVTGFLVATRLCVSASIFFSSSATLESVFFWRFLVGCVMTHSLLAFLHLLHAPSGSAGSGSHLTLRDRQLSHARGFLGSVDGLLFGGECAAVGL